MTDFQNVWVWCGMIALRCLCLEVLGTPGWRVGEAIGVLVERNGRQVFQAKQEVVEATAERLETLRRFRAELEQLLATWSEGPI